MDARADLRVVLTHDWLTGMRGGEKCLAVLCRRWPGAPLFTLLHKRGSVSPDIERRAVTTSFLQRLPGIDRYYRYLLPLMPAAVAGWRLPAADLVVSFSHCVAKAAPVPAGVAHVCYCFTPMRYAWHQRGSYFGEERLGRIKARLADAVLERLRQWDQRTARGVTHFLAISKTVQRRIAECYGRSSTVIYPPVDTEFYCPAPERREDYYLIVSAFAPYKRLDLAIGACQRLGRRLVIIGAGQDHRRLRMLAGPNVQFLGWQPDLVLRAHLRRCRALLFPGEEDFGIVPLEAQACGTPVVAFGQGGATETVNPLGRRRAGLGDPTGVWFEEQTPECLETALQLLEQSGQDLNPAAARRNALRFNQRRFEEELLDFLYAVVHPAGQPAKQAA